MMGARSASLGAEIFPPFQCLRKNFKPMKIFIENEAGSRQKNLHNEKTLEYEKSILVSRPYPFPYGFILDTTGEDGDNVDVFVLTSEKLKRGDIVEGEAIALMEQVEKSWGKDTEVEELDHNVIAVLFGAEKEVLTPEVEAELREFVLHVFDFVRPHKTRVGAFLDQAAALKYIADHKDKV